MICVAVGRGVRIGRALHQVHRAPPHPRSTPGGSHSAAPAEPIRWALPCPEGRPSPNALAKCGESLEIDLGFRPGPTGRGIIAEGQGQDGEKRQPPRLLVAVSTVVIKPRLGAATTRASRIRQLSPSAIGFDAIPVGIDGKARRNTSARSRPASPGLPLSVPPALSARRMESVDGSCGPLPRNKNASLTPCRLSHRLLCRCTNQSWTAFSP